MMDAMAWRIWLGLANDYRPRLRPAKEVTFDEDS